MFLLLVRSRTLLFQEPSLHSVTLTQPGNSRRGGVVKAVGVFRGDSPRPGQLITDLRLL